MKRRFIYILAGFVSLIVIVNLIFWLFVRLQISPIWDEYERGRILRIGSVAFVFGHGTWAETDAVEKHMTTAFYRGENVHKPTLDLVKDLYREGVRWIWGTWCYAGDRPYIERDLVTGEETPWPSYVSRSKSAGVVIPVWLVVGFARFTNGEISKPPTLLEETMLDTVYIPFHIFDVNRETGESFEARVKEYIGFELRNKGFHVRPDSVSKVYRDTVVYEGSISVRVLNLPIPWHLSLKERERLLRERRKYWDRYSRGVVRGKKVDWVTIWIRGRAIRVWLSIDPYIRDINELKNKTITKKDAL